MNIVFTPTAWEQYTEWQMEDKKMVKRINEFVKDIDRNGLLNGIGKPEALKIKPHQIKVWFFVAEEYSQFCFGKNAQCHVFHCLFGSVRQFFPALFSLTGHCNKNLFQIT